MPSVPTSPSEAIATAMSLTRSKRTRAELIQIQEKLPSTKQPSMEFLRIQALRADVGPAVHRLFDQVGVPFVSEGDASKLCASAIDHLHVNAFREIHHEHPEPMLRWLSQAPAIGSLKIAGGLATGKLSRKRMALAEMATLFGADWCLHRPGIIANFPKGLAQYDEAVAAASAALLKSTTAIVPVSPRPRF